MAVRQWSDLSNNQRTAVLAVAAAEMAFAGAAWIDLARRPAPAVNGSKAAWAAIICINFAGPLAYFRWGRKT